MYFRTKRSGGFDYLQVAERHRVDGNSRQGVVATLCQLDRLKASGELNRLVSSGARCIEALPARLEDMGLHPGRDQRKIVV